MSSRLQFTTRHLLILTAAVAAVTAAGSYKWGPRVALLGGFAGIFAMTIVGIACLFPERYARWLRPLAIVVSGTLAMAFGLWMQKSHWLVP